MTTIGFALALGTFVIASALTAIWYLRRETHPDQLFSEDLW